jgi:hypothetical protein
MFKVGDKVKVVKNVDANKWYDKYIGQTATVAVSMFDKRVCLDLVGRWGGPRTYWRPEEVELVNIPKQLTFIFTE